MIGGFLVALAAVGTFAAYTSATTDRRVAYLVASHDLEVGHRITSGDLAYARSDLPRFAAARAFRRPGQLVGAVVLGPVGRGELLQQSAILRRGSAPVGREISFSVDANRAVDGQLQPGEYVDVLTTYGTGADAYTVVVVRGGRVIEVSTPKSGLSDNRSQVITLSVATPDQALALAHAASAGVVTLVRSAESGSSIDGGQATYRSPKPSDGSASQKDSAAKDGG